MIKQSGGMKEGICRRMLGYDKDIAEIIQFGSSVYAPEYALDVDLLVITKDKKEYGGYLDCLDDFDFDCDVVVREAGDKVKSGFACNILGAFEVLYGEGGYLKEMTADFEPRFREAKSYIRGAKEDMGMAGRGKDEDDRDRRIKTAFNSLFHAARLAAMNYLATENTRWDDIKRRLPQPYRNEFKEFINTLHVDYFYNGNYPSNYEEAFEKRYEKVEEFVSNLEEKRGR